MDHKDRPITVRTNPRTDTDQTVQVTIEDGENQTRTLTFTETEALSLYRQIGARTLYGDQC